MQPTGNRLVRVASRTYSDALEKLGEIASNRRTTQLFDKTGDKNLNAAALPEMRDWLRRAGHTPQDLTRIRHIHVAGTKGKGSVCAHATAMLRQYGSVGTYTSPHLVSPRERIAINGEPVGQDLFAKAFFEVWDRFTDAARREAMPAEQAEGSASKPFYFRFMTILAWHLFLTQKIENVVMECGIGGEYDATNILPAEAVSAAVITQLGIDHVAMLGDTVEQIAWHKAGILKRGVKAFTQRLDDQPMVMQVLRARAAENGADLQEMTVDQVRSWGGVEGGLKGDFQKYNQALAVMAVREHLGLGTSSDAALLDIPDKLITGLREAKLRGRCEVLEAANTRWYLDGAHTKDSLEQVAQWFVQSLGPDESAVLIFNQQERNASELLAGFLAAVSKAAGRDDVFQHALFTRNELTKSAVGEARDLSVQKDAAGVMRKTVPACNTSTRDNIPETIEKAKELAAQGAKAQKVLVTGSLHLVGGIMQTLEPDSIL